MAGTMKVSVTIPSEREIRVEREFAAPRAKVFEALTRPELVRQWLLGPPGWTMPVCEIDLRPGGAFRYVWKHADKDEMGVSGTFREIVRPELGGATLAITILYATREARVGALQSGMDSGLDAGYDRLEALLEAAA